MEKSSSKIDFRKNGRIGETVQGFVTNTHRFVDRVEAKLIAEKANQIKEHTNFNELYSEDIY